MDIALISIKLFSCKSELKSICDLLHQLECKKLKLLERKIKLEKDVSRFTLMHSALVNNKKIRELLSKSNL